MFFSHSSSTFCLRILLTCLVACSIISMVNIFTILQKKQFNRSMATMNIDESEPIDDDIKTKQDFVKNSSAHRLVIPPVTMATVAPNHGNNRSWCKEKILRGLDHVIVYNAVPKTGSRTISSLARELFGHRNRRGKSIFIPYELYRDEVNLRAFYKKHKTGPRLMRGHSFYTPMSGKQYTYINIIRDPVERYISHLYYSWYGDSNNMEKKAGIETNNIDECVLTGQCHPTGYLPFFCGFHPNCSDSSNRWSLDQAVSNLDNFLVVGLTEEMDDTIRVLQKLLPDVFKGISSAYKRNAKKMKKSYTTVVKKPPLNQTVQKLREVMSQTYEFYDIVKRRFHDLKKCLEVE
ncbi:uronyl 2-sulfotransferase-like [Apostichopus japonicus]|uniref:uronyl 2-sulfotransferase-like n=1 Tax=Stichopus japonicus TaxID=307972 RepID=UPI003AB4FAB3